MAAAGRPGRSRHECPDATPAAAHGPASAAPSPAAPAGVVGLGQFPRRHGAPVGMRRQVPHRDQRVIRLFRESQHRNLYPTEQSILAGWTTSRKAGIPECIGDDEPVNSLFQVTYRPAWNTGTALPVPSGLGWCPVNPGYPARPGFRPAGCGRRTRGAEGPRRPARSGPPDWQCTTTGRCFGISPRRSSSVPSGISIAPSIRDCACSDGFANVHERVGGA